MGDSVTLAETFARRFIGLLGRQSLKPSQGIWLEPCRSVHMFFMRFPIDVLFVDRRGRVVSAVSRLRPWRIAFGGAGTTAALELPVGMIEKTDTRPGDVLDKI